jgi:hypothetical protein
MKRKRLGSRTRLLLTAGAVGAAVGCSSLLDVTNPATFGDEDLNASLLAPQIVAGVVSRFQAMYDDLALYSAFISDEAVSGHNFETIRGVDLRQITKDNSDLYAPIQGTRAEADSFEVRLIRITGDSATRSLGLARVQAYGAMSYVLAGEYLCASPIDPNGPAVSPDSMFKIAITKGLAAAQTGTAYKTAGGTAARADSMISLGRLAAARAYLNLGDKANAITQASQIPAAFEMRAFYDDNNFNNVFLASTTGANRNLGVDVAFRGLNDPRVRHGAAGVTGHDQTTVLFIPSASPSFGGYSATTATGFLRNTSIRFASGLEAQYIRAEAEGLTAGNLTFINSRRAVGNQLPLVAPTAAEFLDAVIDQRRRDFFLDGHRLGDLRRYIRLYQKDFFPKGLHPNQVRGGSYGTNVCFPPTQAEIVGNPNYKP